MIMKEWAAVKNSEGVQLLFMRGEGACSFDNEVQGG